MIFNGRYFFALSRTSLRCAGLYLNIIPFHISETDCSDSLKIDTTTKRFSNQIKYKVQESRSRKRNVVLWDGSVSEGNCELTIAFWNCREFLCFPLCLQLIVE